jgi:ribosomal protein L11 methyltransferase
VLDFGTGTGVLGLAAARLWHKPVVGLDIDPAAIHVARENARRNGLYPWFRAYPANRLRPRRGANKVPFDLIFANLFARPLVRLAPAIAAHLAPGGHAVLSGLLRSQAPAVVSAYRYAGLALCHRDVEGEWVTLTLRRPTRSSAASPSL